MWFRVDDKLHSHPKVIGLSLRSMGLWVKAGSWCGDHLTDGAVPRSMLAVLGARPADARELVDAGLWDETPAGWQFADWAEWNPSRTEVEDKREQNRQRMANWREAKKLRAIRGGAS